MTNSFTVHMSNEEVSLLPAAQFGGEIIVVDDLQQVEKACKDLLSHPCIGFDTETRPSFKAGVTNRVALLQLSTPSRCYLFRLCKIPLDRGIIKVLTSRTTLKIGADIANDLRALKTLRHFRPDGFVDLQSIASQWGIAEKSVRKMSAIVLGERVSKAQRLSNWEAASMTRAQQLYAATDAWVCMKMYGRLMQTEKKPLPPEEKPRPDKTPGRKNYPEKP